MGGGGEGGGGVGDGGEGGGGWLGVDGGRGHPSGIGPLIGHSAQSSLPSIRPSPRFSNAYGSGAGVLPPCLSHCSEYSPRGHRSAQSTHLPRSTAAGPPFAGATPQLTRTCDAAHFSHGTQTPSGLSLVGNLPWQPARYSFKGHGGHSAAQKLQRVVVTQCVRGGEVRGRVRGAACRVAWGRRVADIQANAWAGGTALKKWRVTQWRGGMLQPPPLQLYPLPSATMSADPFEAAGSA